MGGRTRRPSVSMQSFTVREMRCDGSKNHEDAADMEVREMEDIVEEGKDEPATQINLSMRIEIRWSREGSFIRVQIQYRILLDQKINSDRSSATTSRLLIRIG
jgi:hypothetical protein